QLADRLAVIDKGTVIAEGTPGHLKAQVGSVALTVRMLDPASREDVAAVLAEVLGRQIARESDPAPLSARLDEPAGSAAALTALAEADLAVETFALGQPSLDEVFLTLTGEHPPDPADGQAPADDKADDKVDQKAGSR